MILATHGIIQSQVLAGYNPLTTAWIAATGETDATIINALNTLEQGMIDNSLTSKFLAFYPMVGGTATKHKYNFLNTSQYSLVFNGGWTHSSTGAKPNYSNAYADTGIIGTNLNSYDSSVHFYCQSEIDGVAFDFGYVNNNSYWGAIWYAGRMYGEMQRINGHDGLVVPPSKLGHFSWNLENNSSFKIYRNGSYLGGDTNTDIMALTATKIYLGAVYNNGSGLPFAYSDRECSLFTLGSSLTSSEESIFNTLITTFQTSLSRNV